MGPRRGEGRSCKACVCTEESTGGGGIDAVGVGVGGFCSI